MVKVQEHINKTFSPNTEEIRITSGLKLEGEINLDAYKDLKLLSIVDCGLTNFDFLATIPNKERLKTLDLGHNPVKFPKYQKGLELIGEFINLE